MEKLYLGKGRFPDNFFDGAANRILELQRPDGAIPWFNGGAVDPWNHTEAAMGLSILGHLDAARTAYDWLADNQLADGSWWAELGASVPVDLETGAFIAGTGQDEPPVRDSNFSAYIATGVWHFYLITRDRAFLERMWPIVARAMGFVLSLQSEHGEIRWAAWDSRDADDALRTGNASIYKSLECAIHIAREMGEPFAHWMAARARLGQALRHKPHRFDRTWESKERYSMDWYYPVLSGAMQGEMARLRLSSKWDVFVEKGHGCRCVADEPWVTVAETCELALALLTSGQAVRAMELFSWIHKYRHDSGAYWMGYQMAEDIPWPAEMPAWTAGAVLLAADALSQVTPASRLFLDVLDENATEKSKRFYHR
jgi:hypothetical protein